MTRDPAGHRESDGRWVAGRSSIIIFKKLTASLETVPGGARV